MLALLLILLGQTPVIPTPEFSRGQQIDATSATVRIFNDTKGEQGSGVILGKKDKFTYVLTANHVVKGGIKLRVETFPVESYPKPNNKKFKVEFVYGDDATDLALLKIAVDANDKLKELQLCPKEVVPDKGNFNALSVGCGDGKEPTCLIGKVLRVAPIKKTEKQAKTVHFWEVDCKFQEGRSGGPLIDHRGWLLGVLSGTSNGKSYFSHTAEIRAFLKKAGFE